MSERNAMITLLIEMRFVQLDGKGMEEGRDWPSARYIRYAGWRVYSVGIKQFLSSPFSMPRNASAKGGAVCKGRNTRQAAFFRFFRRFMTTFTIILIGSNGWIHYNFIRVRGFLCSP